MGDVVALPKTPTTADNLIAASKELMDEVGEDLDCLLLIVVRKSDKDIGVIVGPSDDKAIFLEHMAHKIIHRITDEDLGQY